jgi:hypothetical protein
LVHPEEELRKFPLNSCEMGIQIQLQEMFLIEVGVETNSLSVQGIAEANSG